MRWRTVGISRRDSWIVSNGETSAVGSTVLDEGDDDRVEGDIHSHPQRGSMRGSELWKEHSDEPTRWQEAVGRESQGEYHALGDYGREKHRKYTARVSRYARTPAEEVCPLFPLHS